MMRRRISVLVVSMSLAGCSSTTETHEKTDEQYRAEVVQGMREALLGRLSDLVMAARDLQVAAPVTAGRGWDVTEDAVAIASMKNAWLRARAAYEHVEGAIAPLFPNVDTEIDARYDDFLQTLAPSGDWDPFDDSGATGMHAVERILYSDVIPARVIEFESALFGYVPATFPATDAQAGEFKNKLCSKLVSDTQDLRDVWQAASNYDLDAAFQGLIALMNEQREKVDKASTNEEESRYAQNTMKDVRDNLAGTRDIYALFRPWIRSKAGKNGSDVSSESALAIDAAIESGFNSLDALYSAIPGDAMPEIPSTWSSANPTPADAASAFGQLYLGVRDAVDANRPSSVVAQLNAAAALLGFPEFVEAP